MITPIDAARPRLSNGPAAAAILSAAVGCFTIGLLQLAADISPAVNKALVFYKGSGALSGETTIAIVLWLALWFVLNRVWRLKTVKLGTINVVSMVLLVAGIALTFPPIVDAMK
ncbi:MAG: hypothetical protein JSS87_14855 [Acidobacteria bacterium]|nr:hypothetical protein [Acidobacteriota bacterium]